SIEEMAVEYVRAIRALQPVGPYFLCGWSMGGLIAYEIARRLQQGQKDVAFLAILDQGPRRFDNSQPRLSTANPAEALRLRLESLTDGVSDEQIAELRTEPALVQLLPQISTKQTCPGTCASTCGIGWRCAATCQWLHPFTSSFFAALN